MGSFTVSATTTFTITHARYIASKVATDLKRLQGLYRTWDPSDAEINSYEAELSYLLKHNAVDNLVYGYNRNGLWTPACVRYTVAADGSITTDDDPGKIRTGHDIDGAVFTSFLTYSEAWWQKSEFERNSIKEQSPISRTGGSTPGLERGYWSDDRYYSAAGRGVSRSTVKGY
jgi:Bacterial HORMA domain family 1